MIYALIHDLHVHAGKCLALPYSSTHICLDLALERQPLDIVDLSNIHSLVNQDHFTE